MSRSVFLSSSAIALGSEARVEDLSHAFTDSAIARVRSAGVECYRRAEHSAEDYAAKALRRSLAVWDNRSTIDLLMHASVSPPVGVEGKFAIAETFKVLTNRRVAAVGISLQGCANIIAAIRLARGLILNEELDTVAVVTSDVCPSDALRLGHHGATIMSDGAAACIVSAMPGDYEIEAVGSFGNLDLWTADQDGTDPDAANLEWVRGLQSAVSKVLAGGARPTSLLTNNLGIDVMRFMATQCGLDASDVFTGAVAQNGHVFSADVLLNLIESEDWRRGRRQDNGDDRLLMVATSPFSCGAMMLSKQI